MRSEEEKLAAIAKERRRLAGKYSRIEKKRKAVLDGLFYRAAFMRVQLEELEEDLTANGVTEEFSQGDQPPYMRERPEARVYNNLNGGYQKIIKQLTDALPKDEPVKAAADPFEEF